MIDKLKRLFWSLPCSMDTKRRIRNMFPVKKERFHDVNELKLESTLNSTGNAYIRQILNIPTHKNANYIEYVKHEPGKRRAKLIAYYLTQYHPTEKNNLWWGKGTTEWTNVTKAVPQFVGHIQPRLPSDLGFYDLRILDNMIEQVKIAKNYGIDAFCFYYYWFNGERALELPLNMFVENQSLNLEFAICWCNEDWTKRYSGISNEVLLSVGKTEDSYKRFIYDVIPLFKDSRYIKIDGKPLLIIYRPSQVPNAEKTLNFWRNEVKEQIGCDLYIIASQEARINIDWTVYGFDAISQFQPSSIKEYCKTQNNIDFIRPDFDGSVYDYNDIVDLNIDIKSLKYEKMYPAVMPSWDNTSRRNQHAVIFHNSTPQKYYEWLMKMIDYTKSNSTTEADFVFINAWNEWGEGAYMEPDREYGYAYLEETYKANMELQA